MRTLFFSACLFFVTALYGEFWTTAAQLNHVESQTANLSPSVSIDHKGVIVALWEEKSLPTRTIRGAIMPRGSAEWVHTSVLSTQGVSSGACPQVKQDARGNAFALWSELRNNQYVLCSAQLPAGSLTWIPLGEVSLSSKFTKEEHRLAVDPNGNAVAVWLESSEGLNKLFGSKLFANTSEWILSPLPISSPGYHVTSPSLGIDGKGTAIVVWRNFQKGVNEISGAVLPFTNDIWTPTGFVGSQDTPRAPCLAVNAAGKAVAVWAEGNGQKLWVRGAVFNGDGTNWTPTSFISGPLLVNPQTPKVSIDALGNAIVAYTAIKDNKQVLKVAKLPAGACVWFRTFEASPLADQIIPEAIHLNAQGIATALFQSVNGTAYTLKGASLEKAGSTWKPTNDLSPLGNQTFDAVFAINESGASAAVWNRKSAGITTILANVNRSAYPPQNLLGKQKKASLSSGSTLINILSWSAPAKGTPLQYRIFRDAELTQEVAVVPGNKLFYAERNPKPRKTHSYYVVSEDAFGTFSVPMHIKIVPK